MNAAAAEVPDAGQPEVLLADCLAAPATERSQRLEELCARHPHQSEDLRRLYRALEGFGLVDEPDTGPSLPPERLGPYRLLSLLGSGGMGTVHLAVQEGVGRTVALKLMHRGAAAPRQARERFRREVQALSRLDHPHICPVYDAGEIDGVPFLAMRHVAGETLQARIERRRAVGNLLPPGELDYLLRTAEKLARALHAAHEQGLVHRDVKPGNVMLAKADGEPLLLDFGLARHDASDDGLTQSSDRVGTPAYMAPEQVAGGAIDARTDVYALAASLYEAVTGQLPHKASTREALYRAILAGEIVPARRLVPMLPRDLDVVLATALARDPDRRYASALAFADDLARLQRHEPILARPAGPWLRLRRFGQRHPLATTLVAASLLATAGAWWLVRARSSALDTATAALQAHAAQEAVVHAPLAAMQQALGAPDREEVRSALYTALAASRERWRYSGEGQAGRAVFSPDGRTILARVGSRAVLLERATGRELQALDHEDTVQAIAFAPDSRQFVATGGNAAAVHGLAGERLELVHAEPDPRRPKNIDGFLMVGQQPMAGFLQAAAFAPDGRFVATSASDWCVRVFDAATGALVGAPLPHEAMVGVLAWSPDRRWLATGEGWDVLPSRAGPHHVRLFDAASLAPGPVFAVPGRVQDLDWSPDGRELAVASSDGVARLYDVRSAQVREFVIGSWVWSVRWSPDGEHFVIASRDGSVRVHRRDGESVGMLTHSEAHSARFLPDGKRLVVAFGDLTVRVYDLRLRELDVLRGHAGYVFTAEVSPDGTQVVTASFDGTVRLWDLFDPELPVLCGHQDRVIALAERPDGRLVSASEDGTLRSWDVRTGREAQAPIPLIDRPWGMTLHDDGRSVLCAHWDSVAASYDLDDPDAAPVRFPQPGGFGMGASWASDGRVWTAGRSTQAFVHAADGTQRTLLPWQRDEGQQTVVLARSAQGRMAAGGMFGAITLLNAAGDVEREVAGHTGWIHALAWSPDGAWLASGADDRVVRLWGVGADTVRELLGHTGRVMGLAWSADGTRLASASSDGAARIWRVADGQCEATLQRPGGSGVLAVLWSRDGRFLWTAGEDGVMRAWPATLARLREMAAARLARLGDGRR